MAAFSPSGISNTLSSGGGGGSASTVVTPSIANVTVTLANTEYSHALPTGTKYFRLKVREDSKLQLAFAATNSGTNYLTVFPGFTYESPPFALSSSVTVYFQCYKASQIVEIESWI